LGSEIEFGLHTVFSNTDNSKAPLLPTGVSVYVWVRYSHVYLCQQTILWYFIYYVCSSSCFNL